MYSNHLFTGELESENGELEARTESLSYRLIKHWDVRCVSAREFALLASEVRTDELSQESDKRVDHS